MIYVIVYILIMVKIDLDEVIKYISRNSLTQNF